MKVLMIIAASLLMFSCGTKYNYWDTGVSDGRFEGTMYEYLKSTHEFDSIVKIIERADMVSVFEREDITFIAPPDFIFWKWFYYDDKNGGYDAAVGYTPHGYRAIGDLDRELCRRIVESHVVEGKIMRVDVPSVTYDELGEKNGGGRIETTRNGNKCWLWSVQEPYMGIPDMGPIIVNLSSLKEDGSIYVNVGVVFPDHEPDKGAVIILPYTYKLGDLCDVVTDSE